MRVKFNAKMEFDVGKYQNRLREAQRQLDEAVLEDSNEFVPMKSGALAGSGHSASRIGEGMVAWQKVYAPRLYYNPQYNFSLDVNPKAGGLWFESAKNNYLREWVEIVKNVLTGG